MGVVLYETLTLTEHPRGEKLDETFRKIVDENPAPPRQRAPERKIPPPLEAICMKALEKDPANRFQSIPEMITALRDYRTRALEKMSEE